MRNGSGQAISPECKVKLRSAGAVRINHLARQPVWTLWISLYRQGLGVGSFVWIFISYFKLGVIGVWFGIAAAVFTGWLLALFIVAKVTNSAIGGLR